MSTPSNGAVSRGTDPFQVGASPGQTYRFFTDTIPLTGSAGDDGPSCLTRDLVEILQAGDNKSVPTRLVTSEWLDANPAAALAYRAWKDGRNINNGTPLDSWAGIDRNMVSGCALHNIYTVEQLATVDDGRLDRLGMGARDLRARAQLYLDSQKDAAAAARAMAERNAMEAQLAAQSEQLRQMQAQVQALMSARQAAGAPAPEVAVDQAAEGEKQQQANDPAAAAAMAVKPVAARAPKPAA